MRKQILTAAALASCAGATTAMAVDVGPSTTIGGRVFFDASYIDLKNENAAGADVKTQPSGTGFDVKRFYLSVDHKFNDTWSADLTTDAQFTAASTATAATSTGGTTTVVTNANTGNVTEVMIKKLYLEGKFSKAFVMHVGAYDMPWAPFLESLYGYRYVEKTVTDRLGFANTADWGLNATGTAGDNGLFSYSASVVNGGGYKNPTRTKSPDFEGRVSVKPLEWLTVGAGFYSGHLGQVTAANESFPRNNATRFDFAVGANYNGLRVGAEYLSAKNYKTVNSLATSLYGTSSIVTGSGAAPIDDKADGFSSWVSYSFTDQWAAFGRFDQVKLSKDVAPDLKDTYANVGVAYKPVKPLEFAFVYKHEKVDNGSNSISGGNANQSYTIGGANGLRSGTFNEVGVYALWAF